MKPLNEIIEENKKADEVTNGEIKLVGGVTITAGATDGIIYVSYGATRILLTATVLKAMVRQNEKKAEYDTNDKILTFLQSLY